MKRGFIVFLTLAASIALVTSVATAHPNATKQQVAITAGGSTAGFSPTGRFVLQPLATGPLESDSGTETSVVASQRDVTREGQRAEIVTWVTTCKGKRGSFVFRARMEHVHVEGYSVATGTWKVVRGTGAYAGVTGGGRVATVVPPAGRWIERRDGILTLP